MKVFKLKKWLCGIVMMFALVFITSHVAFAKNENATDEQNLTSSNQGEVGIVRYRIPGKLKARGLRELDKAANSSSSGGSVQLFAAFTSDKVADPEDVSDPVTEVPVLEDTDVHLYVAFRVTSPMKVDIKWKVDGATVHEELNFEDPVDGGNLLPGFWYFAFFKPSGSSPGLHELKIQVKPSGGDGSKNDTCKFLVINVVPD